MKKFLSLVAEDLYRKYGNNLSQFTMVFPNKRARLFFNQHLVSLSESPIWSPQYLTISQLFRTCSNLTVPDQIYLVCRLYRVYLQHMPSATETLDEFYGWGQLLLNDFDDIDKNLVNAQQLFSNIEALHDYDDDSFLTPEQRKVLERFFDTFKKTDTPLKQQFSRLWGNLYAIYRDFNTTLEADGFAYEGALYRKVVEENISLKENKYIFVGFNLLQETEKQLFLQLKKAEKALFYWDADLYYLSEKSDQQQHEAGIFIRQYLELFPNELNTFDAQLFNNFSQPKNITYIATNTSSVQARYAAKWLEDEQRVAAGNDTAIVLCDEHLLPSLLHSVPEAIERFNVTAGLPLSDMPITAFVHALYTLRTQGLVSNNKYVKRRLLKHLVAQPCSQYLSEDIPVISRYLQNFYYQVINIEALDITQETQELFFDVSTPHLATIKRAVEIIGRNLRETDDMLLKEAVFSMYTLLERLEGLQATGLLQVSDTTLLRLLDQLAEQTTIPLHGEPAVGLQIMGMLETRNLDFSHLLVLSCNEGKLPKGHTLLSIIPYSLRQAFGLPTTEHLDALYSYYFHRLLQRATDVTLLYNQATSETNKAEMSRYMLQLLIESSHTIRRQTIVSGQTPHRQLPESIKKDEENLAVLEAKERISPTAISTYLRCSKRFFYRVVAQLDEEQLKDDPTDNRVFGNIFHNAAQNLYLQVAAIVGDRQGGLLDAQPLLKQISVEKAVDDALLEQKLQDANPHSRTGLGIISRKIIIQYLRRLLEWDTQLAPAAVKEMEHWLSHAIRFSTEKGEKIINLGGIVDRIDQPRNANFLRVVDYKTGRPKLGAFASVEEIFQTEKVESHSDYFLQAMLYAVILAHDKKHNPQKQPVSPSLLFIQQFDEKNPLATLKIDKQAITDICALQAEFLQHLKGLLSEIFSTQTDFTPTEISERCNTCPYARLCQL